MIRLILILFILLNGLLAAGLKVAACQFPVSKNIGENANWIRQQMREATNHFFMVLTNSSAKHSWPCHTITPDGLIAGKLPADEPGILYFVIDTGKKYYDASAPFRDRAIDGVLNSGEKVTDPRSQDRTIY